MMMMKKSSRLAAWVVAAAAQALFGSMPSLAAEAHTVSNIVLVHGALVDGSGWRDVYQILEKDGFHVSIVQQPLTGLDADVAAAKRVLDQQDGPVVLVGHSYGGAVITAAGTDPKVKALVYVAALVPEVGESVGELGARMPMASGKDMKATADGFIFLPRVLFAADVAADLPTATTDLLGASQVLTAGAAFGVKLTAAAWHDKPSFGIVATDDKTINPELERFMYKRADAQVTEVKSSHLVYMSQPAAVAKVIETAARGLR